MRIEVPKFTNDEISAMDDDTLFEEIRELRKVISNLRKQKKSSITAEEELCYLQAEAQNRGYPA